MDSSDALAVLRRLTRATAEAGILRLPSDVPAALALRAIRTLAGPDTEDGPAAPPAPERLRAHIDGGSRGNPGPAGIGVLLLAPDGTVVERIHRFIGRATNNAAEYQALLAALHRAQELGCRELDVLSDSELLVRQLRGQYQVRHPDMRRYFALAQEQIGKLRRFAVRHVPRAMNAEADALANRAMDEGCGAAPGGGGEGA